LDNCRISRVSTTREILNGVIDWIRGDYPFGDRRQELVFIGIDIDKAAITAALDACLLSEDEMIWLDVAQSVFADPFL
jgi:G3E family GTPase